MATKKPKTASTCLFLFLLSFLSLSISSSGTLVGLSYSVKGNSAYSFPGEVVSFLNLNKASPGVSVDLYLNESLVKSLLHSESSAVSWLHTHVETLLPHFSIRSIVLTSRSENFSGKDVLARLKAFHLVLSKVHLGRKVKVSVALSLSLLENLKTSQPRDLQRIFGFVEKIRSFVTIEACIDGELGYGYHLVQLIREARFNLPSNDVPVIFTLKSLVAPGARVAAELVTKVSKYLESKTELYAEVSSLEDFLQENLISSPRRELRNNLKITSHDILNPPTTIFQTTPPGSNPPDFPTPTIVTVPATNPVTVTPANPSLTPLPIPSTTPVNIPPATPVNPPGPITNPTTVPAPIMVPGAQPITNPVTTYPAPAGNVPVTTPVTNPVTPPAQINAPAIPGQSWCVARSGAPENQLQSALDYACGIGGADCSLIQQGGSCYNPDTLQSHASFAFNSYYQKNPVATSCDFGGTAVVVSTNPSSGSCVYPSSASSSSTSSMTPPSTTPTTPTTTPTPTPIATAPPATTTASPLLPGVPGSVTPPTVLNSSSPNTVFGSDSPPVVNTSTTTSIKAQHLKGYFTLVISLVTGIIILQV
ncbi:ESX-1 secretion-associated protein EspK [Mangifera indica]|uniref:ESX-1 secretion-associated protein EspK n=1 Tax=Mangifera indica TaxID=29780 RepID=UPI001CFB29F1|nr:ESX-1 secretion-associated protein EspK [Mangifera indica]